MPDESDMKSRDGRDREDVFRTPETRFVFSSATGRPEAEYRYKPGEKIAGRYLVDREIGEGPGLHQRAEGLRDNISNSFLIYK